MKVVINTCYGGFGLSREAQDLYCALMEINPGDWRPTFEFYTDFHEHKLKRDDPVLIAVIEYLGEDAAGKCSTLTIVDVPDDVQWHIHEYDGWEHVAENHRTWS
jgi:hypothetical protein